jgi:hypothetical protein
VDKFPETPEEILAELPAEFLVGCLDCTWVSDPEEDVDIDIIAYCQHCLNEFDDWEW